LWCSSGVALVRLWCGFSARKSSAGRRLAGAGKIRESSRPARATRGPFLRTLLWMMILLYLEPVPPRTTKGEILHFLMTAGGIRRDQVGRIDLRGATAVVEVPPGWETRLVKALDGAALKNRRLRAWSTAGPDSPSAGEDHF